MASPRFTLLRLSLSLTHFLMQSEAVVNAGPAVFISPSGPNPLMVQAIFSAYD